MYPDLPGDKRSVWNESLGARCCPANSKNPSGTERYCDSAVAQVLVQNFNGMLLGIFLDLSILLTARALPVSLRPMGFHHRNKFLILSSFVVLSTLLLTGCTPFESEPKPGPDKAGSGLVTGSATGAVGGAITGAAIGAAGPGAWIGMGFGAALGMFSGLGDDFIEEAQIENSEAARKLREKAFVQEALAEHYRRRMALYPSRDIFPADIFFEGDSLKLKYDAKLIARQIAELAERRTTWSRVKIVSYLYSKDEDSDFATHAAKRRSEELSLVFVQAGIEPRRIEAEGVVINAPLVMDPDDSPARYRQAVEFITVDR